jgi:hypothetical protein
VQQMALQERTVQQLEREFREKSELKRRVSPTPTPKRGKSKNRRRT